MNNKRSKLLIGVLIAAAVVAAVLVGLITHKDVNEVRPETSCKYIVNGDTFTFSKDVVMSCDDKTGQILLSDGDKSIETYAMPLYAESKDMLYLTENMAYYRQSEGNTFAGKRLTALTSLSIIGNTVTISKNDSDRIESDGFLYDGSGAYVFIEPVKITVGENEISDIQSYNRANAIMWLCFSVPFWVSTFLGYFHIDAGEIVTAAAWIIAIPALPIAYGRIYKKYKR